MGEARPERRDIISREQVIRGVIDGVVLSSSVTLTIETIETRLGVSHDAAERILRRLEAAGLISEIDAGTWARAPGSSASRAPSVPLTSSGLAAFRNHT